MIGAPAATDLRARQREIRARCVHPSGGFRPFERAEAEQSIAACFEARVAQQPDRLALRTRHLTWSYAELNQAANRVAHALLAATGEGADPVGILFGNDESFVAASLGVLKAGKIEVLLDPALPRARLVRAAEHAAVRAIVTDRAHSALARELAGARCPVLDVEEIGDAAASNPGLDIAPDALAKVSYTSGSTGTPKGIVQSHRGVLLRVMEYANLLNVSGHDRQAFLRLGSSAPLYALLRGGAYYPVDLRREPLAEVASWLAREEVTILRAAVSTFRAFAETLREGVDVLPHLRVIFVFGEAVEHADVHRYRRLFSERCLLVSSLGAREAGDYAYLFVDRTLPIAPGPLPAGYPQEDGASDILLLGDDGRPVPDGEVGELAVRRGQAAVGYWRSPDQTQAAFAPGGHGEHVYRTGDLGRRLPDGCLLHAGRMDFQVKIRGFRVDLGEVEAALLEIDGVSAAAVAGHEDGSGDRRLVAYVVLAETGAPATGDMRRHLAGRLPEYMVPSIFVTLPALPRTANGKVDRRALPAPGPERPTLDTPLSAARSPLEASLVGMFAEVLGLAVVGADDGFFDLGGHSLRALRLVSEIERRFGIRLPLAVLLEAPTPRALAAILGQQGWAPRWSSLVVIRPARSRTARPPLFCVPGHAGTVLCFRPLGQHLGDEQPLYGLEPRGLDARFVPHTSIEEMAAAYLDEIEGCEPAGPHALAGYSLGGIVAFEMARQLRARGRAVALLALFDASAPRERARGSAPARPGPRLARLASRLRVEYANVAALGGRDRAAYATARLDRVMRRLAGLAGRRRDGNDDPLVRRVARAQSLAARAYRPGPYDGALVLYRAQHRLTSHYVDPHFGWRDLVRGELEVRLVPSAGGSVIQDPQGAALVAADLRLRLPA